MTIQFSGQKTGVKAMTRTPCEPSLAAFLIAAAEGCVRCSSCRACEAAFGCEAVVRSELAVHQVDRVSRFHDGYAAERSLAGSAAATGRIRAELTGIGPSPEFYSYIHGLRRLQLESTSARYFSQANN